MTISYFGFAATTTAEMMTAVCGTTPAMAGPAVLHGYRLVQHTMPEICAAPPAPDRFDAGPILSAVWGPSWKAPALVADPDAMVSGVLWHLTADEDALLRSWELDGSTWQSRRDVTVVHRGLLTPACTDVSWLTGGHPLPAGTVWGDDREALLLHAARLRGATV